MFSGVVRMKRKIAVFGCGWSNEYIMVVSEVLVEFGKQNNADIFFFMNYYSEVGLFGFRYSDKPEMGSFYWIIVILLLTIRISPFGFLKTISYVS